MSPRIAIAGGGIIGASIAYSLSRAGATDITVVEAGQVAGQSSGRSFGWINGSFYLDNHHFALRHAAMTAWRRYQNDSGARSVNWPGALVWENEGTEMTAQAHALRNLNYAVEGIDAKQFTLKEPALPTPPQRCLFFPEEGVVETDLATREMFTASGARVISGCAALGIETGAGRVAGLRIEQGVIPADKVIIAAGTGSAALIGALDLPLPLLQRPGLLMRSRPIPPVLSHILASPTQELRQDAAGRLIAPATPAHQSDTSTKVDTRPDILAAATLERIRAMLPGLTLDWEETMLAQRPVPGDGSPAMGACGPAGLYLAVMHSGATLAALAGELAAAEILQEEEAALLAPYRPQRFVS